MVIGPGIHVYGIILVSGAIVGAYLASVEARRKGFDPNYVWDALIWALTGGIVGARIWHIFTPPPSMLALGLTTEFYLNLSNFVPVTFLGLKFSLPAALAIMNGGLGIPGGVIGGVLGLWLYTRRNKLDFITWVDIATPALPLAQAIGRWGNFVNQELYGKPTDLPWGIYIEPQYRLPAYVDVERFHPIFLYESVLNLLICLALLYVVRKYVDRLRPGDLFLFYLALYPTVRFLLEFIRLDSSGFGNLNINQTVSAATALVAVIALAARNRRRRAKMTT
ncbi:MAG TPA: prolipoprotein diacylglyceryl transferase [Anaerolineales bacterium]|nr:prolipoprotein diacylglyceryl transferase [Anaerolineales bacterium]